MSLTCSHLLKCTLLPVGKVVPLTLHEITAAAILSALCAKIGYTPETFALYTRSNNAFVAVTADSKVDDQIYALLRFRGGGKGGFRKQLEKKGREFARAKLKERRNSTKPETKKEENVSIKKKEPKAKVSLPKAEVSATRTLVKQGLAFVMESCMNSTNAKASDS